MQVDTTQPEGPWEFDGEVTACFDDMLARSIPQYEVMRAAVTEIASPYARGGWVLDLGTSRGESAAGLVSRFGATAHFTLCEIAPPMLEAVRERYSGFIAAKTIEVLGVDLRDGVPSRPYTAALAVLTLQFIPINYRQQIVQEVHDRLRPGGAFVVVEKVLGEGASVDAAMVRLYHERKAANGYAYDDIERKRRSLEGVLVPVTAAWNVDILRRAGFREVDCFWRWMNFAAWIAVKPDRGT